MPISWDEAFDLVAAKLNEIRARRPDRRVGLSAASQRASAAAARRSRTWARFPHSFGAWGPVDMGFGSGQGVKCYHSEHLYGEFWHRAFTVSPDTPLCDYLISCGANVEASGGVVGVWRHADARIRGMKRVQVEPHLSVTGACSAAVGADQAQDRRRVPLRARPRAAARDSRERLDVAFPLHGTPHRPISSAPMGITCATAETKKPLVWDSAPACGGPVRRDRYRGGARGPLRGRRDRARSGWRRARRWAARRRNRRSRELVSHMKPYTPEWAEAICDVPAATIRRIATSTSITRRIGETIDIDGVRLPYRPVAVSLGKTVNNGWGGFECVLGAHDARGAGRRPRSARRDAGHDGAAQSPGSGARATACCRVPTDSWTTRSIRPTRSTGRRSRISATPTGRWCRSPPNGPWSQALGPTHFSWMFLDETPKGLPRVTLPDVWFVYRTNPAISFWDTTALGEKMARFPFMVAFAYTRDETNHYADVLLPEATDLESLQLIRIGGSKFVEQFWEQQGFALRQPAVETRGEARDFTAIATELARRTGLLEKYNAAINKGAAGIPLKGAHWDHALAPDVAHAPEAIWDAVCRAACAELTDGKEEHGLDWWKENGLATKPFSRTKWYLFPTLVAKRLRFELPYQERLAAHRGGARPPPARARHALVGQAARRISGAAGVEGFRRAVDRRRRQGRRPAAELPVLAAHRAQHAVRVGRQRRHATHQGGRRQHRRPSRRDHQHGSRAEARHCRRRVRSKSRRRSAGSVGGPCCARASVPTRCC